MKIDFNSELTSLDGSALIDGGSPITLKKVAIEALLGVMDDGGRPERMLAEQKVRYALLAQSIFSANEPLDLQVEDIAVIKDRIGRAYAPLIVMRAWALLDPSN